MLPILPVSSRPDGRQINAIALCERFQCWTWAGSAESSNLQYLCLRQNVMITSFTNATTIGPSSFPFHIGRVLCAGSEEKMFRVHACSVVAPMEHALSLGNRTEVKHPRDTMCPLRPPSTSEVNLAVPCAIQAGSPGPAFVWFTLSDLLPKPLCEHSLSGIHREHSIAKSKNAFKGKPS